MIILKNITDIPGFAEGDFIRIGLSSSYKHRQSKILSLLKENLKYLLFGLF